MAWLRDICVLRAQGCAAALIGGAFVTLALLVSEAGRAADAARGRVLFDECAACHRLDDGVAEDALGPSLAGLLNRVAGTRADYRYSRALSASGIVWTLETIDAFVADPQALVRGNRMAYAGMSDPVDRADLMAYLAEMLTQAP